jgi:AAHS family 4-hydroxybenzoate transporter-like MFS transporter
LWVVSFASTITVYYFMSWLPTLFVSLGYTATQAINVMSFYSVSAVMGGLVVAILLQRVSASRILISAYIIAILAILMMSLLATSPAALWFAVAIAGASIMGSNFCMLGIINGFYPPDIRTTGGGYATGVGRVGAMIAPMLGGTIVATLGSPQMAFATAALPLVVALAAAVAFARLRTSG